MTDDQRRTDGLSASRKDRTAPRWGQAYAYIPFADYRQGLRRHDLLRPDRWSMRDDGTIRCHAEDGRAVYVWPWDLQPLEEGTDA